MDVVGSEIGQKMRSAIKAKLTELGCYVDDELPDYVMVMVANKRTRAQMEDDLQLFLGDNTELFVNWLHQVLKKLQEVTIAPLKQQEPDKTKDSHSKERKSKDKKDKEKSKKSDGKKSKKKEKEKASRKKEEKKAHKKKKNKHEMIRPNVPPLLMNIEKESEPSITDVFAGQILKNHGITLETDKDEPKVVDVKPVIKEIKRPIVPIIDPATITSDPTEENTLTETPIEVGINKEEMDREMTAIEEKIQGLKQKLSEQQDSLSEDEDFLNIRTEAEELMNDFAEDVFQEPSQTSTVATPPPQCPTPATSQSQPDAITIPKEVPKDPIETLPQIELNLPKRPVRERLGARDLPKITEKPKETVAKSPERFTPEREPNIRLLSKSAKSRLGSQGEFQRKKSSSSDDNSETSETSTKKLTSKVSVLSSRATCASVVRVRPRPRVGAPASSLLLRAVADAHKSLLNAPPKVEQEPQKVKRALVLPMRRCVDAQKIVIQVPGDTQTDSQGDSISLGDVDSEGEDKSSKLMGDLTDKEEYTPFPISKIITNTDYVPSRTSTRRDDTLIVETINIHNPTVDKDKSTQFIVTMDGYHPNAFLAKKLMTEGLLNDDDAEEKLASETPSVLKCKEDKKPEDKSEKISNIPKKRLSDTSEESDTQVIINKEDKPAEKRKSVEVTTDKIETETKLDTPPIKKRKASPIVFDVEKKEKVVERVRERSESASSDGHVTIATTTNTHKYDSIPPLNTTERKLVLCRAFPMCRFGPACAYTHPRCKFAAACTRRGCPYSHAGDVAAASPHVYTATPAPLLASHVVPAANYKTISAATIPNMCKFYPNCENPACHFYHPKPCRFGKSCVNKLECNFYHHDVPNSWRYPV